MSMDAKEFLCRRMTNKELAEWLRNSTNDNVREMIEINPKVGNYITGSYIYMKMGKISWKSLRI